MVTWKEGRTDRSPLQTASRSVQPFLLSKHTGRRGRKTTQAVSMQCTHRRVPYNFVYHWDWRPSVFRPTFQPMVAVMYVCDAKFRTG